MRHWRNDAFVRGLDTPLFASGLKLWARLARYPSLYGTAMRIARALLRWRAHSGRIRRLPVFRTWFAARDLAIPARKSFQQQWKSRSS
jgi:hypothetical protein